jgi:hypothetical protein
VEAKPAQLVSHCALGDRGRTSPQDAGADRRPGSLAGAVGTR